MPRLNATLEETVSGIDWAELRQQKIILLSVITDAVMDDREPRATALTGILHLIDAIQDAAVTECIATEKEVFNLPGGS